MTQIVIRGATLVSIGPSLAELVPFGWTREGVVLTWEHYREPVYSDIRGGTQGPPIDYVYMGATCDISCVFPTFNANLWESIRNSFIGGLALPGIAPDAGILQASSSFILRLTSPRDGKHRTFQTVFVKESSTENFANQHTQLEVVFHAITASQSNVLFTLENIT